MKNVKLRNASALFLLPLLSHIQCASTSSLFLNLLTFLTSRIKLYNPLKVILQVRLLRCWVQGGYLLTHTKESDDYTFIGIAYTYHNSKELVTFTLYVPSSPPLPPLIEHASQNAGGPLSPSGCHWMKAIAKLLGGCIVLQQQLCFLIFTGPPIELPTATLLIFTELTQPPYLPCLQGPCIPKVSVFLPKVRTSYEAQINKVSLIHF